MTDDVTPTPFFCRVNGDTAHNNPNNPRLYVPGEPPEWDETYFDYRDLCFRLGIVRIGWPGTGDLRAWDGEEGSLPWPYPRAERTRVARYLAAFAATRPRSLALVPDKAEPGVLYIGRVLRGYEYRHETPAEPYECAHRVRVEWDRGPDGVPRRFMADALGISIRGGFWRRAFHVLGDSEAGRLAIPRIHQHRRAAGMG